MAVLGFSEPNSDWLRILTSQKSFFGSSSQMLFFGGDKQQPEIRLRSQASLILPVGNLSYVSASFPMILNRTFTKTKHKTGWHVYSRV